jgi:hypothetical protein
MVKSSVLEAYTVLTPSERVRFLLRLAWRLTVVARNYYIPQSEELADPVAVRAINELQHRITAHALAVLEDNPKRYPDDVFLGIVLDDTSERNELRDRVRYAFAETHVEIRPEYTDPATPVD